MKKLPIVHMSFEDLYGMLIGPIKSKLLLTGIEMKIFNYMGEPRSADALAEAIGAHPVSTKLFLDGLAASELVLKKKGLYQNAPVSQIFLVEKTPTYLGQVFTFWNEMWNPALNDLPRLVREGPPTPSPETDMGSEEICVQAAFLANYERAGIAQQMAEIVSGLPEFPLFRRMLDLGGGPGIIGIAIVSAHPTIKGVIFDRPAVVKVTRSFIKEYEMEDRIEVLGGDFNHDSIGEGYDLIWASSTLYFAKKDIDSILKKIYDALNPKGLFISLHEGLIFERTKPDIMALSWMPTALMGQHLGFDQGVIADSMLRVGFKSVRSRTLDTPIGPMDLDIGRK
ncbi:MAG: methyltransferase [Desulfobacterales bacterium]